MEIGLVTLDKNGMIAVFNTAAEQILGYRAREVRGRPGKEIFSGLTDLLADLRSGCQDSKPQTPPKRTARRKDGREIPLVVAPYVAADSENRSASDGVILVFQDAQDLDKMENHLRHLDRLRSLDHFAAGIVHEIRNPLAAISTNAQYMMEKIGPSDQFHEEMQDILADVKNIEGIVSKVLDFAHPSKLQVREVLIEDIVREVLRFSKMALRRQRIRLRTVFNKLPASVKVDVLQIKQVLFNVVRNACDAMRDGGELRVSTTRPAAGDGCVHIEVEDTGRGIAEQHFKRIFDPFFSMHGEGTGLGLSISREIIEHYGGRIEVRSKLGKGTRMRIVLPTI